MNVIKLRFASLYIAADVYALDILGEHCHVYCPPGRAPLRYGPADEFTYDDWPTDPHTLTVAQTALLSAAEIVFEQCSTTAIDKLSPHGEHSSQCGPWMIFHTDACQIGDEKVGSDGTYLVRGDRYLLCGDAQIIDGVASLAEVW